jgi:uncharacterized protein YdaU (DUF1376 family)
MRTYIGDEAALTGHLTPEEFGCYERLRRHYWQHGGLPDDDARLIRITGVDPDRWEAVRSGIRALFEEGWRLPRLDQERAAAADKRGRAIERSQKAAQARWGKSAASATSNATSTAISNAYGMRQAMPQGMLEQCPPAPAPDEVRLGGRVSSYAGARTREGHDFPFDPPATDDEGRAWLGARGVHATRIDEAMPWLMGHKLYADRLETFKQPRAENAYALAKGRAA